MKLWFWKRPAVHRQIEVIHVEQTKLRLHEWRSEATLVSAGLKLWADPDFRMMMAVANNEHPAGAVLPFSAQPHERAAHQARCEGYTIALANLEAMAKYEPEREPLEATFESEELNQKE